LETATPLVSAAACAAIMTLSTAARLIAPGMPGFFAPRAVFVATAATRLIAARTRLVTATARLGRLRGIVGFGPVAATAVAASALRMLAAAALGTGLTAMTAGGQLRVGNRFGRRRRRLGRTRRRD
jgi:hypothetical protein